MLNKNVNALGHKLVDLQAAVLSSDVNFNHSFCAVEAVFKWSETKTVLDLYPNKKTATLQDNIGNIEQSPSANCSNSNNSDDKGIASTYNFV